MQIGPLMREASSHGQMNLGTEGNSPASDLMNMQISIMNMQVPHTTSLGCLLVEQVPSPAKHLRNMQMSTRVQKR